MSIEVENLIFENGGWLYTTPTLTYRIMAKDAEPYLATLRALVDQAELTVYAAQTHAYSTVYVADIQEAGGMAAVSIHIANDLTYYVWFELIKCSHRFIGVKFAQDKPVDTYCDEP